MKRSINDILDMLRVEISKREFKTFKDYDKAKLLLYRVYKVIEMDHLNDIKLLKYYDSIDYFPKRLGKDIFNFLQTRDENFQEVVIKRQKRYRTRQRNLRRREKKLLNSVHQEKPIKKSMINCMYLYW